jgi:hypothetical protein
MILEVRQYTRWFEHEYVKNRANVKHASEMPTLSTATTELLCAWGDKNPLNQQSLDEIIEALKEFSQTAPSITFTLAAPPTNSLKITLTTWCRENIAPNILVTFKFNATILGGMVVRFGSRVFDWSFRRQLLANRERFPEVLRHV